MKQSLMAFLLVAALTTAFVVATSHATTRPRKQWIVVVMYASGKRTYIGPFTVKRTAYARALTVAPADWADPIGVVRPLVRP